MHAKRIVIGIAAMVVAVLGAAFAATVAADEDEVVVGLPVSLSGNWAALGTEVLRGTTLAAEEVNQSGGILGKKLRLEVQDSDEAVSPAKLLRAYHYLRSRGISIFIGPTGTPGGLALAPVAERENVILIAPAVGVTEGFENARGNLFNIQGGWEEASRMLAHNARQSGLQRMGIFSSTHPFEKVQGDAFQREFERLGGTITKRVDPLPDATDLSSEAAAIVRSAPDGIFHSGYNQMALAAKRERELGFAKRLLAIQIDPSRLEGSAGALDGAVFARLARSSREFEEKYRARYGAEPNYPADFGYDAVMLLAFAAKSSGSLNPRELAAALRSISWNGASGAFEIGSNGSAIRKPVLWKVTGNDFAELR